MKKFVWKCENKKCSRFGLRFVPGSYSMKFDKASKKVLPFLSDTLNVCPECGGRLVFEEVIDNSLPEFGVGTFKNLPDSEKKRILSQRYNKDMIKNGNDEKEYRKRVAISKLIGYEK